jgi:hypothetical protein
VSGSRNVLDLVATKENAVQAIVKAIEKHPEASGRVTLYSDKWTKDVSHACFRRSMKILEIEHRFIAYNTPRGKPVHRIEAFHKTLKREYVLPYDRFQIIPRK